MLSRPLTHASSTWAALDRDSVEGDQVFDRERIGRELSDRQLRTVQRQRRDDRVDSASVVQPSVHHRTGLVDAAANLGHDLVDGSPQVRLVGEGRLRAVQLTIALKPDVVVAVHHDFGQGGVMQKWLQGAEPENVIGDLLRKPTAVAAGHRLLGRGNSILQGRANQLFQFALGHVHVVQLGSDGFDQLGVHDAFDLGERISTSHPSAHGGRRGQALVRPCVARASADSAGPWLSGPRGSWATSPS